MAVISRSVRVYRERRYGNPTTTINRDMQVASQFKSPKASGLWTTFPDGSKFRRATELVKSEYWLEPRDGVNNRGVSRTYGLQFAKTSMGGYTSDQIFSGNWIYRIFAPYCSNAIQGPNIITGMRNEAGTKARLDIADNKANIGENLATFSQTLRLFTSPGSSLAKLAKELKECYQNKSLRPFLGKSYRDIVAGRFLDGATRKAAEEYLKYVYGWKPLMQDIYGTVEVLKGQNNRPWLLTGTGKSVQQAQGSTLTQNDISNGFFNTVSVRDMKCTVRCSIWARIDPNYGGSRALNQLGLLNPASLAWELVPWSFVIDWVLPIGSVLQALTAPAGLLFVDGSMSSRLSGSALLSSDYYTLDESNTRYEIRQPATGLIRYEGYTRQKLGTWPSVGLWIDPDPFKADRPLKALALAILSLPRNMR